MEANVDTTVVPPVSKGQKLYQNLINDGYTDKNLGSQDDFLKALADPVKSTKIYQGLRTDGYTVANLGSPQEFTTSFQKKNGSNDSNNTSQPSNTGSNPSLPFQASTNSFLNPLQQQPYTPDFLTKAGKDEYLKNTTPSVPADTGFTPVTTTAKTASTPIPTFNVDQSKNSDVEKQQQAEVAQTKANDKGSWSNIGSLTPDKILGGLGHDAASVVKGVGNFLSGDSDNHEVDAYLKPKLLQLGASLEGLASRHDVAAQNEALPNTATGNLASGAIGFLPDVIELSGTPELKLGSAADVIAKYGGKYAPKVAEMAGGKFPTLMSTKGFLNGYNDAKANNETDTQAWGNGLTEAAKEWPKAAIFEAAGELGHGLTKSGIKAGEDAGLISDNKFVAGAEKRLVHSTAQGLAFSAVPIVTNALQGKGTSLDEIKQNGLFGAVLGGVMGDKGDEAKGQPTPADVAAQEIIKNRPQIDLNNFMNADMDAIKSAHQTVSTPADLQMMSSVEADNAFKESDPDKKQQAIVQSSVLGKLSGVKSIVNSILSDKKGFIDGIQQSDMPDEQKQLLIQKAEDVNNVLHPDEIAKRQLSSKIQDIDNQLPQITEMVNQATDPLSKATAETALEKLTKERKDAETQLKDIIGNQMDNVHTPLPEIKSKPIEVDRSITPGERAQEDAETDKKITDFQTKFPNHKIDPLSDLPDNVVRTFDRIDNDIPTDPVAVQEASDWLYKKYKDLTKMRQSDTRMLTTDQIDSYQNQLGKDITTLDEHAKKYHPDYEKPTEEIKPQESTIGEPNSSTEKIIKDNANPEIPEAELPSNTEENGVATSKTNINDAEKEKGSQKESSQEKESGQKDHEESLAESNVVNSGDEQSEPDNLTKAGDPLRDFADKIRKGKINKLGGFKTSTGFDSAWDLSLEAVAKSVEGGARVVDAIEEGLNHIKNTDWYKSLDNKHEFDEKYKTHISDEFTKDTPGWYHESGHAHILSDERLSDRESELKGKGLLERRDQSELSAIQQEKGERLKNKLLTADLSQAPDIISQIEENGRKPIPSKQLEAIKDVVAKYEKASDIPENKLESDFKDTMLTLSKTAASSDSYYPNSIELRESVKELIKRDYSKKAILDLVKDEFKKYNYDEQKASEKISDILKPILDDNYVPKISRSLRGFAAKIREGKINKLGGFKASTGFDSVWDSSLEVVAKALDGGAKLADAIESGLDHIRQTDWYKNITDKKDFETKYADHLNNELGDENEPEEPKSKSTTGTTGVTKEDVKAKEAKGSGGEVKKTILTTRAYEGEIQDDVKEYLEKKGLTRQSFTQEERSKQATDFINKFGEDAAFQAVKSGDVDGGMAASILAQLQIRNSHEMAEWPIGTDERDAMAKKQANYIELAEKKGYLGGEYNGQLAYEYQNADLDYANVKKQVEKLTGKPLTADQEQNIKKITDENEKLKTQLQEAEGKLIDETDKAFKSGQEAVKNETKAAKAKRIADKLRQNAKLHRPGVFNSGNPATLAWDAAVEITAKSIEAGGKLADAIDEGVKHIKNTDWYNSLSESKKKLAENEFKGYNNDNAGSTDLKDMQERFLDKSDNKFSHAEARDIWAYMKENYIDNGSSYRDAISKTADDLGLSWRQISEAITTPKNKPLSDEMWKKQADFTRNRTAIKDWVANQNKSAAGKALQKVSGLMRGFSVFGHGGIFMGTHAGMTLFNPSTWNKTIPAFFNGWKLAYGKEANYQRAVEELKNSPNYTIAQRAGLKNNPERLNAEEYQRSQKYLGRLGIAGERGFNAVKILRQDLFDYHYNKLTPSERDDPATAESIAHLVNLATGATNVKIPSWVNEVAFAGGMEAARWEKLTASPLKATTTALNALINPSKVSTADKVFAKVWARRVGEQLATYSTLLAANAAIQNTINPKNKVNYTNPNAPDFMKFKFGDMTIDPTSGMRGVAMFMRTIGKIPFESKKDLHGDKRIAVLGKETAGYARGKLAPLYGTAADFFTSQDFSGNVMPYSSDKPAKSAHKLTWPEYAWSKTPLPVAEAAGVFYKSALQHGADKKTLDDVMKGIMSGAISGTTGFRVGEYNAADRKHK